MTTWLIWRLVKWIGLFVLGYGTLGAVWGLGRQRHTAGLWMLPAGLLLVYVSGFGLLEIRQISIGEPWVAASLLAGVIAAGGAALHVTTHSNRGGAALAIGGVLSATGFMVFRDTGLVPGAVAGVLGGVAGAFTAVSDEPAQPDEVLSWFKWLGRAEGVSLLFLFGIAMPVKYGLGNPTLVAWGGWLHGVLFMLYVAGIIICVRRIGMSLANAGLGLVASLLPFGTFVFERRLGEPAAQSAQPYSG